MRKEVSALLDGELESHEIQAAFAALRGNPALRQAWHDYRLIGDAMRAEPALSSDLTDRVMANLRDVPTVLAPKPSSRISWQQPALALAASAAGVAVVAWLALGPQFSADSGHQFVAAGAQSPRAEPPVQLVAARESMQEYLAAHQAYASGLHLQGGAQHIRTVSAIGPTVAAK